MYPSLQVLFCYSIFGNYCLAFQVSQASELHPLHCKVRAGAALCRVHHWHHGPAIYMSKRLQFTEERDEEGHAEIHAEAMEDGECGEVLATVARDDGQRGVH